MAYRLMIGSVPIMSQQMSLLFHVIPMDAALVENGIEFLKKYIAMNQKAMGSWSMLNPVAINSFGEVKAIERHFTDIDKLMLCSMQDLSASAGIPTSLIFNTQANGFSDQDDDTLLKQSETITLSQKTVGPQLLPDRTDRRDQLFRHRLRRQAVGCRSWTSWPTCTSRSRPP